MRVIALHFVCPSNDQRDFFFRGIWFMIKLRSYIAWYPVLGLLKAQLLWEEFSHTAVITHSRLCSLFIARYTVLV